MVLRKKTQNVLILVMLTDKRTTEMQHVLSIFPQEGARKHQMCQLVADTVRNSISRSGF